MSDERNAEKFMAVWFRSGTEDAQRLRGYVPGLIDTLRVAHVEGLLLQAKSGREQLTEAGKNVLNAYAAAGGSLRPHQQSVINLGPFTASGMWRNLGGGN